MEKMKRLLMCILCLLSLLLTGCSEFDVGMIPDEDVNVESNVDFSSIEYPTEVHVYQTKLWELDEDKIADTFLRGEIAEIQMQWVEGPKYLTASPENEILNIGVADGPLPASFNYTCHVDEIQLDEMFPALGEVEAEFWKTSQLKEENIAEERAEEMKETIEECFVQAGMPEFTLRAYKEIPAAEEKKTDIISFWQQVVDQIPVSISVVDLYSSGSQTIYNRELNYDAGLYGEATHAEVHYAENEISRVYVLSAIEDFESINTIKPVSPQKAWNKVKSEVYQKREAEDAVLEMVELQYLHLIKDGERYLYPVWTIEVIEKDEEAVDGIAYNYYLIDAATGEFFVGIDL